MGTKRILNGNEDLIGWDVLTRREQVAVFLMFLATLLLGAAIGGALVKVGAI